MLNKMLKAGLFWVKQDLNHPPDLPLLGHSFAEPRGSENTPFKTLLHSINVENQAERGLEACPRFWNPVKPAEDLILFPPHHTASRVKTTVCGLRTKG